jgi:hypothetical protein
MLDDQLRSSRKYVDESEYDAGPLMSMVFEQTVEDDVYSPDGDKGTLKFRVSLRTQCLCTTFWFICTVNPGPPRLCTRLKIMKCVGGGRVQNPEQFKYTQINSLGYSFIHPHVNVQCPKIYSILSNLGGGYMLPRSRIAQHDVITAL